MIKASNAKTSNALSQPKAADQGVPPGQHGELAERACRADDADGDAALVGREGARHHAHHHAEAGAGEAQARPAGPRRG